MMIARSLLPHQHHPLLFLEAESFIESGQNTLAGGYEMKTYDAQRLEVGEALLKQLTGDALSLVLGCHGEVVDLEGAAIMEQHGSTQNEACHFAIHDTFQAVMLLAFKQFTNMDSGVFHRPVVVPGLARKRRRINGTILAQMLNSDGTDDEILHTWIILAKILVYCEWLESIERDMRNMDQPKKYVSLEQFGQELMAAVKSKICM